MGNVYEAMKRRQAEQRQAESDEAARPSTVTTKPEASPVNRTDLTGAEPPPAAIQSAPRGAERRSPPDRENRTTLRPAPELVSFRDRGGRSTEEYRSLRTNLLAHYEDKRFCLLVTSSEAGEGKTVTTLNLAGTLSELPDRRTIVVDCDLQKGSFEQMLNISGTPGVADVLRRAAGIDDVIRHTSQENLDVITAGHVPQGEVGELLGRPELEDLVRDLQKEYDYVLLDTPPIRVAGAKRHYGKRSISYSTAGILGRTARQALLVVRMNKTRRESVQAALGQLKSANVEPVGLVLTHQRHYIPEFLYRLF